MAYKIEHKIPKSMLNKGTGFLSGYTHSLNPYSGCSFGCSYCYVRQMPVSIFRGLPWGSWVDVKKNAAEVFRRELLRAQSKGKVTIFMSSSTDPYQPVEAKECITRSLLEVMVQIQPDFLLVQTRSPLVKRDVDLLTQLGDRVRVSMTIETDLEPIRRHFTPGTPSIEARLRTLKVIKAAGIPAQATIAPVLPSSENFPDKLLNVVDRICIDDYYMGDGSGGKRTHRLGLKGLYEELGLSDWYQPDAYKRVVERFIHVFPPEHVRISQQGFEP